MSNLQTREEFIKSAQINNMGTPNHIYSAIDWLRTFAYGSFTNKSLLDLLFEKRNKAIESFEQQTVWIGEDRIFVQPSLGWGVGKNSMQIVCKYRGIEFAVNRREEPDQKAIEFLARGEVLTEIGFEGVRDRVAAIERMLTFNKVRECVGEVHFACDVKTSTNEIIRDCVDDKCVTRGRKWDLRGDGRIGGQYQTLELGRRHQLFLRIYNKEIELQTGNEKKEEAYRRCVSQGELFDDLTRIEFEVGRKALVERNIDTLEDLQKSALDLLHYLVFDWFRIHDDDIDRKHTWRGRLSQAWREVVRGFDDLASRLKRAGESTFRKVVREPSCIPSHTRLLKMCSGYLSNYFVWMRKKPTVETVALLLDECIMGIQSRFFERFQKRNGETFSDYLERKDSSDDVSRSMQGALAF